MVFKDSLSDIKGCRNPPFILILPRLPQRWFQFSCVFFIHGPCKYKQMMYAVCRLFHALLFALYNSS